MVYKIDARNSIQLLFDDSSIFYTDVNHNCYKWNRDNKITHGKNTILLIKFEIVSKTCYFCFWFYFKLFWYTLKPNKGLVADEKVSANKRKMFRRSKDSRNRLQRMRSQKRVKAATSAVAIMTVSFYICWLPYAITSTISIFGMSVAFVFSVPSFLFAKLGVLANPIIYIFFNQEVNVFHKL